jgi:vacuolar-type H+-ATPase subunit I/STV1
VAVNEYTSDVAGGLEKSKAEYAGDINRKVALNVALFNIRKSVAQANATSGISDILADVQTIDAVMTVYSGVATKAVAKSVEEITARVEKLKTAPADSSSRIYGDRYNTVETSVVDQSTIDMAKAKVKELKRQKQTLQDKLLALNVNTTITITDTDAMALKTEGII